MKRILLSMLLVMAAGGAIATGATGAFFSDTETSTGNTFAAGDIDLKIDNDSYYNRNRCTNVGTKEVPDWEWVGTSPFPVPGSSCETSFPASDLEEGLLFFNFTDVKPDDEGEDTISLHAGSNEAYMCLDMALTSNDDVSSTEPELGDGDAADNPNDTWDGELAQNIQMLWWADDGDNVYEVGENLITDGVQTIETMFGEDNIFSATLADSETNIWGEEGGIPGGATRHIAKAWCFGTLTPDPVPGNGGVNPSVDPGINCDGTLLDNVTQTDALTLDVAFRAVQTRHNGEFICGENRPRLATITVTKEILNNNGGNNVVGDFQLFVDNGTVVTPVTSGEPTSVVADTYTVGETGVSGYVASFPSATDDCDAGGQLTVAEGESKECTILNDDLPATITLIKNVINNNGGTAASSSAWGLRIDGNLVQNNTSVAVNSNVPHFINEDGRAGYHFVSITGAGCPSATSTPIVLNEGESITCTITNDDNIPPPLVENFGTGACLQDIPGWDEDPGESCPNGTVAAAIGVGDNTASPDGGRFGLLGNSGYICRSVNAAGLQNLQLKYYWRGDSDAEAGDNGSIRYYTGGTCAAPTGEVTLATHPLTTTTWSALQTVNLPGSLNNTSFFVRFTADTNNGNESFRVDGLTLSGSPL